LEENIPTKRQFSVRLKFDVLQDLLSSGVKDVFVTC